MTGLLRGRGGHLLRRVDDLRPRRRDLDPEYERGGVVLSARVDRPEVHGVAAPADTDQQRVRVEPAERLRGSRFLRQRPHGRAPDGIKAR